MKFALACYGTRGDVEPSVSIGCELQRRGHDVRLAVPPDLVGFAQGAGLTAIGYGPPLQDFLQEDFLRNFWTRLVRNPVGALRELWAPIAGYWASTSATLLSLAQDVDLLSTGLNYEQSAANVAEHYGIPMVALHHFPMRPNGRLVPALPPALVRSGGAVADWLFWCSTRRAEDAQRRELGLARARVPAARRMARRGVLEIQAYDEVSVPGLADEWAKWGGQRPFVGALTMGLATDSDAEVAEWIASGSAPICFATGSIPVESPSQTVEMIASACSRLGERALICAGGTDISQVPEYGHVKVVGAVNYATVFPACRAIVHHGGSGTIAASLRAGVPTLVLWTAGDQPFWGAQLRRLQVGTTRRLSTATEDSLVTDLQRILTPEYAARARVVAEHMTTPADSIARAADLVERYASASRHGRMERADT